MTGSTALNVQPLKNSCRSRSVRRRHSELAQVAYPMELELFLNRLETDPGSIEFPDVIALINNLYHFIPTGFRNGNIYNEAGKNTGSCKVFAFARLQEFSEEQTLALFGAYYRSDVLKNPDGDNHANIRRFMETGWKGIEFDEVPLRAKS